MTRTRRPADNRRDDREFITSGTTILLTIDKTWRPNDKGIRPYKFARRRSDGTIHPVRYSGYKQNIGIIQSRDDTARTAQVLLF